MLDMLAQIDSDFPGIDGFLQTRASFMLDVVFLSLFAILPVMLLSIYLVKYHRKFHAHKRIQLILGGILLAAVTVFELEQRIFGWEERAIPSPFFNVQHKWTCWTGISLLVHLLCAIPCAVLWIYVIAMAWRRFPNPPTPGDYSRSHIFWARLAAGSLIMTALTGWLFYWLAFVAE